MNVNKIQKRLGWAKDKMDNRDFKFPILSKTQNLKVDLRSGCPGIYDQGDLGSCTSNAIAAAYEFDLKKFGNKDFVPSRLFIYYNERLMEGTVMSDSGAYIRDGIKSINTIGVCHETMWPYITSKFAVRPIASCFTDAKIHKSVLYRSVTRDLTQMKSALASGFPFTIGFLVYESFLNIGSNGIMTMPRSMERLLGGHAVLAVGYDDSKNSFICRNSWGLSWGDHGYFYMPYQYLTSVNLSSDFWVVTSITG